jgi:hypothetical protein
MQEPLDGGFVSKWGCLAAAFWRVGCADQDFNAVQEALHLRAVATGIFQTALGAFQHGGLMPWVPDY